MLVRRDMNNKSKAKKPHKLFHVTLNKKPRLSKHVLLEPQLEMQTAMALALEAVPWLHQISIGYICMFIKYALSDGPIIVASQWNVSSTTEPVKWSIPLLA